MDEKRKLQKRIPRKFEMLLSPEGIAGLREAVAANDADWYVTAAGLFDLGVAEWRKRDRRNTAARNIVAALWWAWHKQREIVDAAEPGELYMLAHAAEVHAWDTYVMAKRMEAGNGTP
jgi:hypothetical protein